MTIGVGLTMTFMWIDYVIIAVIAFSVIISIVRGFVKEALSLVTWVIALWGAMQYYPIVSTLLKGMIASESIRIVSAFFILFASVLIVGALINFTLSQLVRKTGLSGTDRVLGLLFGVARGTLLAGVIVLGGNLMNISNQDDWKKASLVTQFQPVAHWLAQWLPNSQTENS